MGSEICGLQLNSNSRCSITVSIRACQFGTEVLTLLRDARDPGSIPGIGELNLFAFFWKPVAVEDLLMAKGTGGRENCLAVQPV